LVYDRERGRERKRERERERGEREMRRGGKKSYTHSRQSEDHKPRACKPFHPVTKQSREGYVILINILPPTPHLPQSSTQSE